MTEEHKGDKKSTKAEQTNALSDAIRLVIAEIDAAEKCLEIISKTEDAEPVSVDGQTFTGCNAIVWTDPSKIAAIMLRHNYHCWDILGMDAPNIMWREIAELVGLDEVFCVDISLRSTADWDTNTKTD